MVLSKYSLRIILLLFVLMVIHQGVAAQDRDGDGHEDSVDNCPWMVNELQADYNGNGVGDDCEESPFLTRKNRSVLFQGIGSGATIKNIVPILPSGAELFILHDDSGFDVRVEGNDFLATHTMGSQGGKIIIQYSIGSETKTDTLHARLMSKFWLNRTEGVEQNGYMPVHYSNRIAYTDGLFELENEPPFHFEFINPILESAFIIEDLDTDGLKDLVGGIPTIYNMDENSYHGVARLLVPIYYRVDNNLNIEGYHENIAYPEALFHNQDWGQGPSIYDQTDTLFSLGEHYHSPIFPDWQGPASITNAVTLLDEIGLFEGVHYDDWGFKRHHYTTFDEGRAVSNFTSIDLSYLDERNDAPFVNPLSYAYGDLDNDGKNEWLIGSQVRSDQGAFVLDIISRTMDGLSVSRTHLDPYGYTVSAEGAMVLMDINGDGWKDLVFNDYWSDSQSGSSPLGILFNDQGQFDYSNPVWVANPYPGLEMKEAVLEDFDGDGAQELLVHWAMLYPDSFRHLYDEGQLIMNRLAVYQIEGGTLVENTQPFIPEYDKSSPGVEGQLGGSMMQYLDIDGDGKKDIHISYTLAQDESGNEYTGGWRTDFLGAWYFRQTQRGIFEWTEIGVFDVTDEMRSAYSAPRDFIIGNQLQPVDLDGNGIAEFIHQGLYDGSLGFTIFRKSGEGFNLPPTAVIDASSLQGQTPYTVDFNAIGSNDPNGDTLSFRWTFGDGNSASGEAVSYTYSTPGEFVVILEASDGKLTGLDSLTISVTSGVGTESNELPGRFILKTAYPNPFNPVTNILYGLPVVSEVRITAHDLLGRHVATLVPGERKTAGYHSVQFNAGDLASGTYLIKMEAGGFVATQQIVLMK